MRIRIVLLPGVPNPFSIHVRNPGGVSGVGPLGEFVYVTESETADVERFDVRALSAVEIREADVPTSGDISECVPVADGLRAVCERGFGVRELVVVDLASGAVLTSLGRGHSPAVSRVDASDVPLGV